MKKSIIILIVIFLFEYAEKSFCQNPNINEIMMRSTYYIYGYNDSGFTIQGTCFMVGKPVIYDSTHSYYYILVTAKHILESITDNIVHILIRMKEDNGYYGIYDYMINIRKNLKNLYYVPIDTSLDVAAMFISLPNNIDLDLIPYSFLGDEKKYRDIQISPGDNVFCVGFPHGKPSNKFYFPILTNGVISSYPIYPVDVFKYILVNINIFSGNSGGPVYLNQFGRSTEPGNFYFNNYFMIIGIISSEYMEKINDNDIIGMKIAKIVPSCYIKALIDSMPDINSFSFENK